VRFVTFTADYRAKKGIGEVVRAASDPGAASGSVVLFAATD
jgi:hypothetical protein